MAKNGPIPGIVACDVMREEIEAIVGDREAKMVFLDYALHDKPKEMPDRINTAIREILAVKSVEKMILGYGLCSNGTVGVKSETSMVLPRCHDCISLLLGSISLYREMFKKYPGTYFLTSGWIRNRADPLSSLEYKYIPRLGEKKAKRGMALELANYKTVCFINNGVGDVEKIRARTMENCRAFDMEFLEVKTDLDYFRQLIDGPYPEENFISLTPEEPLVDDNFYLEYPEPRAGAI